MMLFSVQYRTLRMAVGAFTATAALVLAIKAQAQSITLPLETERAADSTFQFIIVGDTQLRSGLEFWREQNAPAVKAVLDRIASERPAFTLFLGDDVFYGGSSAAWSLFDSLTQSIRDRHIPMISLMGNHDYLGSTAMSRANFYRRFPLLNRRSWNSLVVDSVGIILLDSNFGALTNSEYRAQLDWYTRTLKDFDRDAAVTMIIVACHHALYTNSTVVSDNREVQRLLVRPFMQSAKTRLFITGHCHAYEHFVKGNKQFIVSGGCGPFQRLKTDPGKIRHPDLFHGGSTRLHHFCRVVVKGVEIVLEMHQVDAKFQTWSVADIIHLH